MQEEIEEKTVRLAISGTKLTGRALAAAIRAYIRHRANRNLVLLAMTLTVDSDGELKSDFDYEDISEDSINYEEKWEKKYLK